jgi:hypothetical protein
LAQERKLALQRLKRKVKNVEGRRAKDAQEKEAAAKEADVGVDV